MKPSALSKTLIPALLGALWLGCASAPAKPASPPVLTLQEASVPTQGLTDATVHYAGQVVSPVPGVLEKADYELVSDGQVVKTGTASLNVPLTPNQPTAFSFDEHAAYVRGPDDLKALSAKGGSMLLALRGTLTVRSGQDVETLPFAASRSVRVPRLPEVVMESMDVARYSASEVNVTFRVGVKNPNPFPLRLDQLNYGLQVAGKSLGEGILAKADSVQPSSTGVYPLEASVSPATWGTDVNRLIAKGVITYTLQGELTGPLMKVPYMLQGEMRLNVSK